MCVCVCVSVEHNAFVRSPPLRLTALLASPTPVCDCRLSCVQAAQLKTLSFGGENAADAPGEFDPNSVR